jgi:EAL domain-containing protein (putative c-di-GMP-specific phosphodiesterase class I)
MNKRAQNRLRLENALRRALARHEFELFYQPLVDFRSGEMNGSEALLRWRRNGGRPISAERLIPLAEETGLIVPIGEWVLRTACKQTKQWIKKGLPPIRVGVNLSGRQLGQDNIVDTVTRSLELADLDPDLLNLELTESTVMEDADKAVFKLEAFRKQGIRISVDDFGTGYSSLSYLSRLPIDKVKIDKSFISAFSHGSQEEAIVKAIIAVAHSLGFRVTGEGVETRDQLSFLVNNRCDEGQGYLFSKPVPPDRFARLLNDGSIKSPLTWQ